MSIAMCSYVDDGYAIGLAAMLRSLRVHNPHIDCPFLVYSPCELSERSRHLLLSQYGNIRFVAVDGDVYGKCRFGGNREWKMSPALRYDLFRETSYERLIYFDADLLVVGNIDELFEFAGAFGACALPPGEGMELRAVGGFNAGVLCIGREVRTPEIWNRLLEVAEARDWSGNQTVLNLVLKKYYAQLPEIYNVSTTRMTPAKLPHARIIHFVGKYKPWESPNSFGEHQLRMAGKEMCDQLLGLWRSYSSDMQAFILSGEVMLAV